MGSRSGNNHGRMRRASNDLTNGHGDEAGGEQIPGEGEDGTERRSGREAEGEGRGGATKRAKMEGRSPAAEAPREAPEGP